jgi:hypothetical protein
MRKSPVYCPREKGIAQKGERGNLPNVVWTWNPWAKKNKYICTSMSLKFKVFGK